jgi:Ca2+-binding EF-hand superfamily protein
VNRVATSEELDDVKEAFKDADDGNDGMIGIDELKKSKCAFE